MLKDERHPISNYIFMSKLTLQEKLNKKRYHIPNRFIYSLLNRVVVFHVIEPKYNVHYTIIDDINKEKGPAFLVFNHQSRIDYAWAMHAAYPRRINMIIGYNELFRSHLHGILGIANAIPKKNFTLDLPAMRGIDSIIKQGGVVCFSPEGMSSICGHNQPVVESTGKLFKHYGIPVYLIKTKGAFLTNTKVCLDERKGRIDATMSKLFSKEDLEKYSNEELNAKLDEALWQDDYEWNLKEHIKYETHGRICHHLNDLLYRCPKCGSEFTMVAEGNEIHCSHCGNGATMDDYYAFHKLHDDDVIPETPSRWFDEERREVYREISKNENFSFEFVAEIGELPKYKYLKDMKTSEKVGKGKVTIDHKGFHFNGEKNGEPFEMHLAYESLPTFGMPVDTSYVAIYHKGQYYDIFPDKPVVGKILLIVEEMARLHVGSWKNFPWMKWIYE